MGNNGHPVDLLAETLQPSYLHFRHDEGAAARNAPHVFATARGAAAHGFQHFHAQNRLDRACIHQRPDDVYPCWATDGRFRDQETPQVLPEISGHASNITTGIFP